MELNGCGSYVHECISHIGAQGQSQSSSSINLCQNTAETISVLQSKF